MNQKFYDNPAQRLLDILQEGKKIPHHKNCLTAWQEILIAENRIDTVIKLGKVASLPDEIEVLLRNRLPVWLDDAFLYWSNQVRNSITNQDFSQNWSTFLHSIDSHTINYLKMTANAIEISNLGKEPLKQEEINELIGKTNELINLIKQESSLNESSKIHLTKYLNNLIVALHEYHITGNQEVFYILESLIGHSFIDEEYAKILSDQNENSLGKKVADFISFAANLISVTTGVPLLAEAIQTLLQEK